MTDALSRTAPVMVRACLVLTVIFRTPSPLTSPRLTAGLVVRDSAPHGTKKCRASQASFLLLFSFQRPTRSHTDKPTRPRERIHPNTTTITRATTAPRRLQPGNLIPAARTPRTPQTQPDSLRPKNPRLPPRRQPRRSNRPGEPVQDLFQRGRSSLGAVRYPGSLPGHCASAPQRPPFYSHSPRLASDFFSVVVNFQSHRPVPGQRGPIYAPIRHPARSF